MSKVVEKTIVLLTTLLQGGDSVTSIALDEAVVGLFVRSLAMKSVGRKVVVLSVGVGLFKAASVGFKVSSFGLFEGGEDEVGKSMD